MRTLQGILKKSILGFDSVTEHEGFVIEKPILKEGSKTHWVPITSLHGTVPEEFNRFENKFCHLIGERDGLMFRVKMIEYYDSETDQTDTWSV